ncbi:MAG: winged helix-turn-helix domain-containing protein [Chloroflexota bacterium]|nr:winged helix-turn-helix domain-containing protein [Chloroflexota bacterium]
MAAPVRSLLQRRSYETVVGRTAEVAVLRDALTDDGPLVTCVHGLAGMGKTTLLEAFLAETRSAGVTVVRLDGRTFEPTPAGFLAELARAIAADGDDIPSVRHRLGELGERVMLAIDTYENLRLIDGWLRTEFVPALTNNVRVILAGREVPLFAWQAAPGWQGFFRSVPLRPLSPDAAIELLDRHGVDPAIGRRLNALVRGHPLALVVGASAIRERPNLQVEEAALPRVIEALATVYLDQLDPQTRQALDAAAVVRRMTRSLFRAMVPDAAPEDGIERLRRLPFVDVMRDGLVVHESVQHAVAGILRATDPERYRALKAAAWRELRLEVAGVGRSELWRYTADMLFLLENPVPRNAFFPPESQSYAVDQASPSDQSAIFDILDRHLGAEDAHAWKRWWERLPNRFRVVRETEGEVAGFCFYFDPATVPSRWLDDDPVCAFFAAHLAAHPMSGRDRALMFRGWLGSDGREPPGSVQAACWLDLKRAYMELRPQLRRVYSGIYDIATYGEASTTLGFALLPGGPLNLDGSAYYPAGLEFGPGSVDAWLAWLVAGELGLQEPQLLDVDNRQLVLDHRRIDLTPLEFRFLQQLLAQQGRTVTRRELLEKVWGYDHAAAGSNVVDALARSARRKLGDRAGMLETVRGLGYRIRAG